MNKRTLLTLLLIVLVLVGPYWLYLPALLLLAVFMPYYWEGLIIAFFVDVMYGTYSHKFVNFYYPYAFIILLAILTSFIIRRRIRIHA
jgi:hypothetical protein